MLTDAEISVIAKLEAFAAKDEAERDRWIKSGDCFTAWHFEVKALNMRTAAARLIEEHVKATAT